MMTVSVAALHPVVAWKVEVTADQVSLVRQDVGDEPHTMDAICGQLPGGAYTTLRTYERRKALNLEDHICRLEHTAQLSGKALLLERSMVREALRLAIQQYEIDDDLRLRMVLDLERTPGELYLVAETLVVPSLQDYRQGVKVALCKLARPIPKAKLTVFIARAEQARLSLPADVNEALMVGLDGQILEGLSSNFFAVKDGVVWTAEERVLSGTTRKMVLQGIMQLGIPLRLQGVMLRDLPDIDEAFITSASRAILPVRQIEQWLAGEVGPGPFTRLLMANYDERLRQRLEII